MSEERRREVERRIHAALIHGGLTLEEQRLLVAVAARRGAANAVVSRELAACAGLPDSGSERARRWVATVVETLVLVHGIPIGASRVKPCGYFLIETREDLEHAIRARWSEVYAQLRFLRALAGGEDVARLLGQAALQFGEPGEAA